MQASGFATQRVGRGPTEESAIKNPPSLKRGKARLGGFFWFYAWLGTTLYLGVSFYYITLRINNYFAFRKLSIKL